MTELQGETPSSMRFSTMSTFEAGIFRTSPDPATELKELFASLETNGYLAHMRIAGILASMGQRRHLGRVRHHFSQAFALAELDLHLAMAGELGEPGTRTAEAIADRCGSLAYCLGEVCEQIGRLSEAQVHFQRGVGYYNVHSSLKLALYAKLDGHLDRALHLLTSASDEKNLDVEYLLGDHFSARKDFDRARKYFASSAALGQERAAKRLKELDAVARRSFDSHVEEDIDLGFGWTASIDHVEGGIYVYFEDDEVDHLKGWSLLTFIDHGTSVDRAETSSELEEHRLAVDDLKQRSITFRDSSRTGLLQVRVAEYSGAGTVAAVVDHATGDMREYQFDDLPSALRELAIAPETIAPPAK